MTAADLDMRKLRYFVAVAEELHFGRAASRLHIAQPVLSRQIRALERELGVDLLSRDSRGTRLTPAGEQLLGDARFLLAESKALQDRLFRAAEPVLTVTVGVMPGLLATAAVQSFEAGDPARRVRLIQVSWADQVSAVLQGRADIVYAREPFDTAGLGTQPLLEEPRDVALHISDPLACAPSVQLRELADRRLLQDAAAVPEWYAIATPAQRRASATAAADTVEDKLGLVAAKQGFVILPHSTSSFYRRPDVAVVPITDFPPSRVTLIWDATVADTARDDFLAAALACRDQTI
ncbi:MAG: LysR family transcriptional regulator [Mycobacterium sp.]